MDVRRQGMGRARWYCARTALTLFCCLSLPARWWNMAAAAPAAAEGSVEACWGQRSNSRLPPSPAHPSVAHASDAIQAIPIGLLVAYQTPPRRLKRLVLTALSMLPLRQTETR